MKFVSDLICEKSPFWLNKNFWVQSSAYEEDFKAVMKLREMKRIPFQHLSPQITLRSETVHYLKLAASEKKLSLSCLHLAVYLLDIFMDNHAIAQDYLKLVANVCLIIAAKFEENLSKIPKIAEINALVNNRYPVKEYKAVEVLILNFYYGYVMYPTVAHFIYYYMQAAVCPEDLEFFSENVREVVHELHNFIRMYLDKIIDDVHLTQYYYPSQLAASVLCASRIKLGLKNWTQQLEKQTDYKFEDLQPSLADLLNEKSNCIHCESLKTT